MNIGWPSISHEFQLITKIDEIKNKELHRDVNTAPNVSRTLPTTAAKVNEVISCVIPVAIPISMAGGEQNGNSRRQRLSHLKIYDRLMTNSLKFIINLIIKSAFDYVPSCLPSFLPFLLETFHHHCQSRQQENARSDTHPQTPAYPFPFAFLLPTRNRQWVGLAATQTPTAIR